MEEQKITDTVKVEAEPVPKVTLRDVVDELEEEDLKHDDEPEFENTPEEVEAKNLMLQAMGEDPAKWQNAQLLTAPPKHIMKQAKRNLQQRKTQQEPPAENKIKQAIDRMLLCYCQMQQHMEEHEDDFSEAEVEAVTDMAIDLLVRVFPRLQGRSDEQTHRKALNYLKIYDELYKLKQTETRRQLFLDEFTDVIRLGEMEEFFLETSLEMAKPIQQFSAQLDAQVNASSGGVGRCENPKSKTKSRRR